MNFSQLKLTAHVGLQEHEAESKAAEAAESAPDTDASKGRMPEKGEDISDKDVSKIIVVKQSRTRQGPEVRSQAGGAAQRGGPPAEEAHVISDGLQFYERELQVGFSFFKTPPANYHCPSLRGINMSALPAIKVKSPLLISAAACMGELLCWLVPL